MNRKLLLLFICLAVFSVSKAQWQDSYQPRPNGLAAGNDVAILSPSGDVYVAGILNNEFFTFGGDELEQTGKSTYLVKYNAAGDKQWALSFNGASTPTAMVTDSDGNLYVAGNFAGDVVFGSTDNNTQSKTGILDDDQEAIRDQGACFLAKYSPAGVLLKVETYVPQPIELVGEMKYDELNFYIKEMKFYNNQLVAAVIMTGITANNGITLQGTYMNYYDIFSLNLPAGAVISIDKDLQFSQVYVTLCPPEGLELNFDVNQTVFDIHNGILYAGFYTLAGQEVLTVGNSAPVDIDFDNVEDYPAAILFAKIDLSTGNLIDYNTSYSTENYDPNFSVNSLKILNNKMFVSGSFGGTKAVPHLFDENLTSNNTDVYVANINADDFSQVVYAKKSDKAGNEKYTSCAVYDGKLNIACNDLSTGGTKTSGIFSADLETGNTGFTDYGADIYINSLCARNGKLVKVEASNNTDIYSTVTVSLSNVETTGIFYPKAEAAISFYPNPVISTLYLSKTSDISIYNMVGLLVKKALSVSSLDVDNLPAGVYVATVQTVDGKCQVKFIKK